MGASEAIGAGATAFVAKSSPAPALERLSTPPPRPSTSSTRPPAPQRPTALTRRQREILQLYANGLSTEDAAQRLGVSTETVRTHTKAVLARLARPRPHPRGRDRHALLA